MPGSVNNVIRTGGPIKSANHTLAELWLTLLEKIFRGGPVGLGALHVRFDARDFSLQGLDPLLELRNRQGIEVLLAEGNERIVGLARKKLFEVHRGANR